MHQHNFLLLMGLLLAVVGTNFHVVAMHTVGASSSSTKSSKEAELNSVAYEGQLHDNISRVGKSKKPTEFLIVDLEEKKAVEAGYHFRFISTEGAVKIRRGQEEFSIETHKHRSPYAGKITMKWDEKTLQNIKAPKDLEGIELHILYEFGTEQTRITNQITSWDYGKEREKTVELSNREKKKELKLRIPRVKNAAPTEEEKQILKAIFIGGHTFRVEVKTHSSGEDAEISFLKLLTPGRMQFTVQLPHFLFYQKYQMEGWSCSASNQILQEIKISTHHTTFTIDWATTGIQDIDELRMVVIQVDFRMTEINGKYNVHKIQHVYADRDLKFIDFPTDRLEQVFVGGQATITFSQDESANGEMSAVTVAKSSLFGMAKDKVKSLVGGMGM